MQACRYLSERLVEAWEEIEQEPSNLLAGAPRITPEGAIATGALDETLIPQETDERMSYAQRIIAQRCLYGADKNPLAVEMAKLGLWLLTLAKDKPFTFLDHAIRCGDSLIGIHHPDQIRYFTLDLDDKQKAFFTGAMEEAVAKVIALRRRIEARPANSVEDAELQRRLLDEAEALGKRLGYAADLLLAVEFRGANASRKEDLRIAAAVEANQYLEHHTTEEFKAAASKALDGHATFHWPLEFPEVFVERGGFDAFIGNPPFMGGKIISTAFGQPYASYLRCNYADAKNTADLCAYFFQRAYLLLRASGCSGLLATNSLTQGDTADAALVWVAEGGATIYRGVKSFQWPGSANVFASQAIFRKGAYLSKSVLDENEVVSISPHLEAGLKSKEPKVLLGNPIKSFVGTFVRGDGFIISHRQAQELIKTNKAYDDVIFPYLNGEDLNSDLNCEARRAIINFFDWSEGKAKKYPEAYKIVAEKVRPFRQHVKEVGARERWWQYAGAKIELYDAIRSFEKVLVRARVSDTRAVSLVKSQQVFSDQVVVFDTQGKEYFALLQSAFHESWARNYGSTLKGDLRYSPTSCFETFPFPAEADVLEEIGEQYHAHRQSIMLARQEGLTKTYNRFHDPEESSSDIRRLREMHQEMDEAVARAYGWTDLRLDHDFHETKQGMRFTISEAAHPLYEIVRRPRTGERRD